MRKFAIAPLLVMLFVLSACDAASNSVDAVVSDAVAKTQDADTVKFSMSMDIDDPSAGALEIPALEFEGALDFDNEDLWMRMNVIFFELELLSVDGEDYLGVVDADGETRWIEADEAEDADFGDGTDLSVDEFDIAGLLGELGDGAADIEELGEDDLKGVKADHYRATIDGDVAGALEEFDISPGESMVLDLWVDKSGRIARMDLEITGIDAGDGSDDEGSATITFEFFDYGEPLNLEKPADLLSEEEFGELMFGGLFGDLELEFEEPLVEPGY